MKKYLFLFLTLAPSLSPAEEPTPPSLTQEQINQLFFMKYDEDKDGKVSREEFLRPNNAQFDFMDLNQDGIIEMSEVAAFTKRMMQPPASQH